MKNMKKATKSTLLQELYDRMDDDQFNYSPAKKRAIAKETVNTVFNIIKKNIQQENRIEIRGFGSFTSKKYAAYEGRNPKTGTPVKIGIKRLPVFRSSKLLTSFINKEREDVKGKEES